MEGVSLILESASVSLILESASLNLGCDVLTSLVLGRGSIPVILGNIVLLSASIMQQQLLLHLANEARYVLLAWPAGVGLSVPVTLSLVM